MGASKEKMVSIPRGLSGPVYFILTTIAIVAAIVTPWIVCQVIALQFESREGPAIVLLACLVLTWTLLRRFYIAVILMFFWSCFLLLGFASLYGTHVTDSLPPEEIAFWQPRLILYGAIAFVSGVGLLLWKVAMYRKQNHRQANRGDSA
jgi:hypothetical protein